MSVTCWVTVAELRKFMRQQCGVETLTEQHDLVSFRRNPAGDLFLRFERTRKRGNKVKAKKKGKR